MKAVTWRIRRLEEKFGPPVETEFSRRLRERLDAAERRVAAAEERGELKPVAEVRPGHAQHGPRTIIDILRSGYCGRRQENTEATDISP